MPYVRSCTTGTLDLEWWDPREIIQCQWLWSCCMSIACSQADSLDTYCRVNPLLHCCYEPSVLHSLRCIFPSYIFLHPSLHAALVMCVSVTVPLLHRQFLNFPPSLLPECRAKRAPLPFQVSIADTRSTSWPGAKAALIAAKS